MFSKYCKTTVPRKSKIPVSYSENATRKSTIIRNISSTSCISHKRKEVTKTRKKFKLINHLKKESINRNLDKIKADHQQNCFRCGNFGHEPKNQNSPAIGP